MKQGFIRTGWHFAFWNLEGMRCFHNRGGLLEHISLVGGVLLVAALPWPRRGADA